MSKMHTLKSRFLPGYLRAQATGARTFEIRKNDRNFKIGDELWLREYNSETKAYTDNGLIVDILHISPYMQKENHVILETKLKAVVCSQCGDECDCKEVFKLPNGKYIYNFCKYILENE
ncbi:DUF3850 domain-containing protein [Lactobacillus johnsonii]|uniref:DUF3850 domain-containing protein n=1 Tax=Lactobacillus johnsonii TaxID=33959 RepID=UPI0011B664E8|nr:DUF3850 domain-containing protein [Lactobacillus johnsonii]TWU79319.1 hypothetical protein DLD91_01903 [Lactobacillus johnsonii]